MIIKAAFEFVKNRAVYILLAIMAFFCIWIYQSNTEKSEDEQINYSARAGYEMYTKNYIDSYGYRIHTQEEYDNEDISYDYKYNLAMFSEKYTGYYKVVMRDSSSYENVNPNLDMIVVVAYLDDVDPDLKCVYIDGEKVEIEEGKIVYSRLINRTDTACTNLIIA